MSVNTPNFNKLSKKPGKRVFIKTILASLLATLLTGLAPVYAQASSDWIKEVASFEPAWSISKGAGVTVAVLDSGVNRSQLSNATNVLGGLDLIETGTVLSDPTGHGTSVVNALLYASPDVTVLPVRVIGPSGASMATVATGIIWAVDNGAKIINLSFGGPGTCSQDGQDAVNYAYAHNVSVFAAVGNSGSEMLTCPAGFTHSVGVGSVGRNLTKTASSNTGSQVSLVAPGENIVIPNASGVSILNGTSFATPLVSGLAALLLAKKPSLSVDELTSTLVNTAQLLGSGPRNDLTGYGLVDPFSALLSLDGSVTAKSKLVLTSNTLSTAGDVLNLNLTVTPNVEINYTLYSSKNGIDWLPLTNGRTSPTGIASVALTPLNDTHYSVCTIGTGLVGQGCSNILSVKVPNALNDKVVISNNIVNGSIEKGLLLKSVVTNGNPRSALANASVTFKITTESATAVILSAVTDANGYATVRFTPSSTGEYSILSSVTFEGTGTSDNSTILVFQYEPALAFTQDSQTKTVTLTAKGSGQALKDVIVLLEECVADSWVNLGEQTVSLTGVNVIYNANATKLRSKVKFVANDYQFLPTNPWSAEFTFSATIPETSTVTTPISDTTTVVTPIIVEPAPEITPPVATPAPVVILPAPVTPTPVASPTPVPSEPSPVISAPIATPVSVITPAPLVTTPVASPTPIQVVPVPAPSLLSEVESKDSAPTITPETIVEVITPIEEVKAQISSEIKVLKPASSNVATTPKTTSRYYSLVLTPAITYTSILSKVNYFIKNNKDTKTLAINGPSNIISKLKKSLKGTSKKVTFTINGKALLTLKSNL